MSKDMGSLFLSRLKPKDIMLTLAVYLLLKHDIDGQVDRYLPLLAAAKTNIFLELQRCLEREKLKKLIVKLNECCADVGSLRAALDVTASHIYNQTTKAISKQSYLGRLSTNVAKLYASFNIDESVAVWEAVQCELKPLFRAMNVNSDDSGHDLIAALKSVREAVKPISKQRSWYDITTNKRTQDKSDDGSNTNFMLDLNGVVNSLLSTNYYQKDSFEALAKLGTGFIRHGYWKPVLLAINEALSQERLAFTLSSKEDSENTSISDRSIQRNRALLGWLLQVCDLYNVPTEELPETLQVPQERLRQSFAKLSHTDLEHAEVFLWGLQSELTIGNLPSEILKTLSMGASHWPAIMQNMDKPGGLCLATALHSVSAQLFSIFGLGILSLPHTNMAYKLGCEHLSGFTTSNEDKTACAFILTNMSLHIAFHDDDIFGAWKILAKLSGQLEYVDLAQRLVYCLALVRIHEAANARILFNSLDWAHMPQKHQEYMLQLEIILFRYEQQPLEAWKLCYKRIEYHKKRQSKYMALWYTVMGIRCLVESNKTRHLVHASALITAAKSEAIEEHKVTLVFELALLHARIELLSGNKEYSIQRCEEVQHFLSLISIRRLKCEWQLLYTLDTNVYDLNMFAHCFYTEFHSGLENLDNRIFRIGDTRSKLFDFITRCFVQPTPPLDLDKLMEAYCTNTNFQPFIPPPSHSHSLSPITPVPLTNNLAGEDAGRHKRQWLGNGSPQRRVSSSKRRTVSFGRP